MGSIEGFSTGLIAGRILSVRLSPSFRANAPRGGATPRRPLALYRQVRCAVFLVEDHADTHSMAKLLRRKHEVHTADSAAEALDLATRHSFDLVISDLGLPDRSGLELMRHLRDAHRLKGICISGYGMEEMSRRDAGFLHHLTKPINFERLQHAIRDIADRL